MKTALICLSVLLGAFGVNLSFAVALPAPEAIAAELTRLGAEMPAQRTAARQQLNQWGERFPRYLLQHLAGPYASEEDPERLIQIEMILRQLAAACLFYQPEAYMGVNFSLEPQPDNRVGIRLNHIMPDSPATRAGLQKNDLVLGLDGQMFSADDDAISFADKIRGYLPREPLELLIQRQSTVFRVTLILDPFPDLMVNAMDRLQREHEKLEQWLQELRTGSAPGSAEEPVGHFRLD